MSTGTMPSEYNNDPNFIRHSDEMQDIITAIPSRFIRWGMFLFFCVFVMIIGLAASIHFPDMAKATLTVTQTPLGEILVRQADIQKVHAGQQVLIKFKSYPFEQYGIAKGRVKTIAARIDNAGNFTATVAIDMHRMNPLIQLKQGMTADAEIITQDATILQRISRNIIKGIDNK